MYQTTEFRLRTPEMVLNARRVFFRLLMAKRPLQDRKSDGGTADVADIGALNCNVGFLDSHWSCCMSFDAHITHFFLVPVQ